MSALSPQAVVSCHHKLSPYALRPFRSRSTDWVGIDRTGFECATLWQPLSLAPLLIAIAYDLFVCRSIYMVMTVGLVGHLRRLNVGPFAASEGWLPVG